MYSIYNEYYYIVSTYTFKVPDIMLQKRFYIALYLLFIT